MTLQGGFLDTNKWCKQNDAADVVPGIELILQRAPGGKDGAAGEVGAVMAELSVGLRCQKLSLEYKAKDYTGKPKYVVIAHGLESPTSRAVEHVVEVHAVVSVGVSMATIAQPTRRTARFRRNHTRNLFF